LIWFHAGDKNVYRYVGSNPVRYRDPSGRSAIEFACEVANSMGNATTIGGTVGIIDAALFDYVASSTRVPSATWRRPSRPKSPLPRLQPRSPTSWQPSTKPSAPALPAPPAMPWAASDTLRAPKRQALPQWCQQQGCQASRFELQDGATSKGSRTAR
jgi:hypothetical protein